MSYVESVSRRRSARIRSKQNSKCNTDEKSCVTEVEEIQIEDTEKEIRDPPDDVNSKNHDNEEKTSSGTLKEVIFIDKNNQEEGVIQLVEQTREEEHKTVDDPNSELSSKSKSNNEKKKAQDKVIDIFSLIKQKKSQMNTAFSENSIQRNDDFLPIINELSSNSAVPNKKNSFQVSAKGIKSSKFKLDAKKYDNFNSTINKTQLNQHTLVNKLEFSTVKENIRKLQDKNQIGTGRKELSMEMGKKPQKELKTDLELVNNKDASSYSEKVVEKLMQKSVLPIDLERQETCPKFYENPFAKKLQKKKKALETAGPKWYNLPKTEITPEVKRDLQVIKMRNVLDNKHHYRRNDTNSFPTYFQMGTVVEGSHEFYSGRLSKKNRKRTMVEELLADSEFRKKNKMRLIEASKRKETKNKRYKNK